MNSPTLYGQIQSFKCDSFYMGDLDGTTLHYLAVRKAMVSLHTRTFENHAMNYSLTWQTDRCSHRRMALKAPLNAKAAFS